MSKLPTTVVTASAVSHALPSFTGSPAMAELRRAVGRFVAHRATRHALDRLDDDQLWDIGLTRGAIEDAIYSPMRRYHGDF
jgi:uncharacterized protein YjiS (DUF1127 family)